MKTGGREKQLGLADAYHQVFETPEGQIVLRDLINEAGILAVADDPSDSRFYDGKRALALHILSRLRWSATELQQLGEALTYDELTELIQREGQAAADAAQNGEPGW